MYKSKELRWFAQTESPSVVQWFSRFGLSFRAVEQRTDFYLPLPENDSLNIKLREGRIEIKQRMGDPILYQLMPQATGYLEDWQKWSFRISEADPLAKTIIQQEKYNWIEVLKERLGVRIGPGANNTLQIHLMQEELSSGCQLEYTKLTINGRTWYTLAAEWFGDSFLDLREQTGVLFPIHTELLPENSYGYNAFLNKKLALQPVKKPLP